MVTIVSKQKPVGLCMVAIVFKQKAICRYGNDCFQTEAYTQM